MKIKIGVMGSASEKLTLKHKKLAVKLGRSIADNDCILITGGCPGLPHLTAKGVKQRKGFVVGISAGLALKEHVVKYESPTKHHDILIYTGMGFMGREIINIRSCDIVIIVGGRSGTLGEFAIAYDEGKLIGVLEGTGGIADKIDDILEICKVKDTGSKVIKGTDPEKLMKDLLRRYRKSFREHSSIYDYEQKIRHKWD